MKEISIFDAKTHFSGIISDVVEHHQEFVIKKRGEKVAMLVPYEAKEKVDLKSVFKAMDNLAKVIGKRGITQSEIKKMKEEGRK